MTADLERRLRDYGEQLDAADRPARATPPTSVGAPLPSRRRPLVLAAVGTLAAASLGAGIVIVASDDDTPNIATVPPGEGATTTPTGASAATTAERGASASTTVPIRSDSTEPAADVPASYVMPDIVGLDPVNSLDGVRVQLGGHVTIEIEAQSSDTVAPGTIISTRPAAGEAVDVGAPITLVVSTGPVGSELTLDERGKALRELLPVDAVPSGNPVGVRFEARTDEYLGRLAGTDVVIRRLEGTTDGQEVVCVYAERVDTTVPGDRGGACGPSFAEDMWLQLDGEVVVFAAPPDTAIALLEESGGPAEATRPVGGFVVFARNRFSDDAQSFRLTLKDAEGGLVSLADDVDLPVAEGTMLGRR
jgi:hypothetical protein